MPTENTANPPLKIVIHPNGWNPPQGAVNPNYNPETGKNIYSVATAPEFAAFEVLLEDAGTAGKIVNGFLKAPGQIWDFAINFSKVSGTDNFKATIVATGQVVYGAAFEVVAANALGLVFESYVAAYTGLTLGAVPVAIVAVTGVAVLMALGYDPINEAIGEKIGSIYDSVKNSIQNLLGIQNEKPATLESAQIIEHTNTGDVDSTIHKGDAKATIEKLGGAVWVNDVTPVYSDGQDYSLVKDGAATNINGNSYFISDVMDTLENASTAVATFISTQVQDGITWLTKSDSAIQLDLANWLAGNLGNLINGQMSLDAAFISLAKYVALQRGSAAISAAINSTDSATSALAGIFKDAGVTGKAFDAAGKEIDLAAKYAGSVYTAISRMAIDFAFNSQGWSAEQYVKSGLTTITSVIAFEYGAKTFQSVGLNAGGAAAAATTLVSGLLNSSNYNQADWLNLGAQVGIAYGSYVAGSAIANAIGFAPGGPVAIVAAAIVSLIAGKVLGYLFGSAVYHDGEFGDITVLMNSIYQVQQVDDGNGGTVTALVAVNANGSTIISQGITTIFGNIGQDVLVGTMADDSISGGAGSDYLEGRDGKDTLIGGDGADHISGGAGDDFISGGLDDDIIFADAGNDTVVSDSGDDFVHLGSGDDAAATGDGRDIVLGGGGSDSIDAGAGDDLVDGGSGDDIIGTGAGNDLVFGNLGNDLIYLDAGDDVAFGDSGNDQIFAGDGNDILVGGEGTDILHGDNGSDIIDGGADEDLLEGGLGNDSISGGDGDDVLLGGMDNDLLAGGAGNDTLQGEFGNDILIGGAGADTLDGGDGDDWYVFNNDPTDINNFITDNGGANDSIVLSWLTEANIGNLALTRVNNDLKIAVSGQNIVTIADQFNGKVVETIEIAGGKTLDISGLVGTGLLTTPAVLAASGVSHQATVDAQLAAIDSAVTSKSQYYNNALTNIVADTAYQELLGDQIENAFYNGNEITSFKRDRGACGGAYTVYKLDQLATLNGTDELLQMTELTGAYNAADYDQVHLNTQKITNSYGLNYAANSFGTVAATATVKDYYDAGQRVATTLVITNNATSAVLFSTQIADADVILPNGVLISEANRLASGTSANVNLGLTFLQTGADKLVGAWWGEALAGQTGPDVLIGNGGNDTLDGGAGNDWIFGGDGNDTAYGRFGDDIIFGGNDNDTLSGNEEEDAIIGGAGDDVIYGNAGADWIEGGSGNDVIYGGDGNDIISGNGGNDRVYGDSGNDNIDGGAGSDYIYYSNSTAGVMVNLSQTTAQSGGDAQGDILTNIENIVASAYNDTLAGDANNNIIIGGAGADTINGGAGVDTATYATSLAVNVNLSLATAQSGGDAQGDILSNIENLIGTSFNDTLTGDANDNIIEGSSGSDTINGGAGIDTVSYANAVSGVSMNLGTNINTLGDAAGDNISNIENIIGSAFSDSLTGDANNNVITGGAGADTINGGAGIDTLSYSTSNNIIRVNLALTTAQSSSGDAAGDIISNIENIDGSIYDDIITGNAANNSLFGDRGNDDIRGGAGNDTLTGGDGNDRLWGESNTNILYGGAGNDTLYGDFLNSSSSANVGNNQMFGEDGNDGFSAGAGTDIMDGGTGVDLITFVESAVGVTVNLSTNINTGGYAQGDTITNIENVNGTFYDDIITGDANANVLFGDRGNDDIRGGAGNDTLTGGDGNDRLWGDVGYNILYGGAGNDILYGDLINSASYAYVGTNQMFGEEGNDGFSAGAGVDVMDGGVGIDLVTFVESNSGVNVNLATNVNTGGFAQGDSLTNIENVDGTIYADVITGDANANVLYGAAGDDTINGGASADTIDGASGVDTIAYAGSSAGVIVNLALTTAQSGGDAQGDILASIESLIGSAFADTLTGDANANIITGGAGADNINGGLGIDTVSYADSSSSINVNLALSTAQSGGDAAGDILSNIENITGSAFNDTLAGTSAANSINGGSGDDLLIGGTGGDTINGGDGIDTVSYADSASLVNVNLTRTGVQFGGSAANDILSNIENIIGSFSNDVLAGNALDNTIDGGSGNDNISGGDGNDILTGGIGVDTINGGNGVDTVSYSGSSSAVTVNLALTTAQSGGDATGDILSGIENLIGSAFNDTLTGDLNNNIITGGLGADTIDGGVGIDTVSYITSTAGITVNLALTTSQSGGDAQGDILSNIENLIGSSFDDTLTGTSAANNINGGTGSDTVSYVSSSAGITVDLNLATAQLGTGDALGDILSNIENLTGSAFNDTLTALATGSTLTGGAGIDTLIGSSGNDTLIGGLGADIIDGGAGIDTVSYADSASLVNVSLLRTGVQYGGSATDDILSGIENLIGSFSNDTLTGNTLANIINGGLGNDSITGGSGVDTLIGGAGADVFKYSTITDSGAATGLRDIISDFAEGTDKVDLSSFAGTFNFNGTGAFTGTASEVNYAQVGGNTILGIDADGNGILDFQIELAGLHTLAASDFLL